MADPRPALPPGSGRLQHNSQSIPPIQPGINGAAEAEAIRTDEARDSRLMMRRLGAFSHRIVASPAYLAAHGTPRVPEDLLGHTCLRHRYPSTGKLERWLLVRDGVDLDLDLPMAAVASTLEPQICLTEEGFGLACLPRFAIRRQLQRGELVAVLEDHVRHVGAFHILWPASRHPSPKVSAFVAFMAENLLKQEAE